MSITELTSTSSSQPVLPRYWCCYCCCLCCCLCCLCCRCRTEYLRFCCCCRWWTERRSWRWAASSGRNFFNCCCCRRRFQPTLSIYIYIQNVYAYIHIYHVIPTETRGKLGTILCIDFVKIPGVLSHPRLCIYIHNIYISYILYIYKRRLVMA